MNQIYGIIDFDGFHVQRTFLVREFGFIDMQKENGENKRYDLRPFLDSLTPQDSTSVQYVEKEIFGVPFLPLEGEHVESLDDLDNHIKDLYESCQSDNCRIMAYKGCGAEKKCLDDLQIPNVNLETYGCPKFSSLQSETYDGITCGLHGNNLRCSEAKVTAFKNWVCENR